MSNTITLDLDTGVRRDQIGGLTEGSLALKCAAFTNGKLDTPVTITLEVDGDDQRKIACEARGNH